jgi:hypothetical protein
MSLKASDEIPSVKQGGVAAYRRVKAVSTVIPVGRVPLK